MKCLDKKRIKMKGGETLALNERIMLSLVSTGVRFLHANVTFFYWFLQFKLVVVVVVVVDYGTTLKLISL